MKRVLFVDDDPELLEGLRIRLRTLRCHWDMRFAGSGTQAIAQMHSGPIDVLVADMRMPGMDGLGLLSIVRETWPETIRIVLSGFVDDSQAPRLSTIAHQYVAKPCDISEIESVIARCLQVQELLATPAMRALVGRIRHLPSLPQTCTKLRSAMLQPDTTVQQISAIISGDPAIAAKVLQVVNSAFFRLARHITRIDQAVSYLGFRAVRALAMSVEVFSAWRQGAHSAGIELEQLQGRAHRVAAAVHALCAGTAYADDALLAGLFHNIGHWVLLQECPTELARAFELARREQIPLHEAEEAIIGASHAHVGAYLLGLWGLPLPVIEAVAFQNSPQRAGNQHLDVLAALVAAVELHQ